MRKTALLVAAIALIAFALTWNFTPRADASKDKRLPTISPRGVVDVDREVREARPLAANGASQSIFSSQEKSNPLIDLLVKQNSLVAGKISPSEAEEEEANDPDLPSKNIGGVRLNKEEYLRLRDEYINRLRGIEPGAAFDPMMRGRAIDEMVEQQAALRVQAAAKGTNQALAFPNWTEIGPNTVPLQNGQYQGGLSGSVTGRATSVVVDPTNSNKVYLGTAQGGVWRSLDGGTTWSQIFDTAQSLAVGAIALAPSNPTILYVGTGEGNNSGDCFFGVGLYRIDNVDTAPTLVGPINPSITTGTTTALTYNVFNGRSITKILVHPTDPATIFVSTAAGLSGISGTALGNLVPPLALRGVFRSTNATSSAASVTFQKLIVNTDASLDNPGTGNTSISDMVFDPTSGGSTLLVAPSGTTTGGGVWRSTNATAATPTFTNVLFPGFNGLWIRLGIANNLTVYASTNEPSTNATCSGAGNAGRLRKSIDGGVTWPATPVAAGTGGISAAAEGYCGAQCAYDNPVMVDPTNSNLVYLAGNARGTCSDVMKRSADGAVTFARDDTGLHADSHSIYIDTLPATHVIWFANDGGIFSRPDAAAGTLWTSKNNSNLGSVQFMSLAVHPTDPNFTIGGTQDNGTEAQQTTPGNWISAEGGDGGYALIDRSSTNTTTNITMYHTFFNQRNTQILFDRAELGSCLAVKDSWETRGNCNGCPASDLTPSCDGTPFFLQNGIGLTDFVNFYAPMALGPGTPNVLYFGTDRLYRSTDRGDTMTVVSQAPLAASTPISSIGIAPQDDNYRVVGLNSGAVWATITGNSTMTNILLPASLPNNPNASATNTKFISRIVIDPTNKNTAYLTLSYYTPAGQGIFKTTNLDQTGVGTVTWTASASGIPSVPINAFAIDPALPSRLFAGTDIGVYASFDSGATWHPFGIGLPRVAVFDMAIAQPNTATEVLRIATHGRGMWEIPLLAPTAAPAFISGRVTTPDGAPLAGVTMNLSGARSARVITDAQGNYRFNNVDTDNFYTVTPSIMNYHFAPDSSSFSLLANKTDASFTAVRDAVVHGNVIDSADYFVRQHYVDFLGREPDEAGFNFWSEQIMSCGADAGCVERRTINVSAAYFLSIEFQETGGLVDGLYRASYNRRPQYGEFMPDTATVARNVIVGQGEWRTTLDNNKQAFVDAWVQRPEFQAAYGGLTNAGYVDALISHASGFNGDRGALVSGLNAGTLTRAAALRQIAENEGFTSAKRNGMFVMMEYFGYLRRDPDEAGFNFWLNKLNEHSGNFEQAEMVKSFIVSGEYRSRFAAQ